MSQRFTIVRFFLGSLLLVAAGLKFYGLSVSAIPRVGWFSQPWLQMAAVEWEAVLGLWLFSGSHQRAAWLAALVTFATFAAISGYLGWIGVASCGCFGVIHASPWWAFGLDAMALTLFLSNRPPADGIVQPACRTVEAVARMAFVTLMMLTVVLVVAIYRHGSSQEAFARLRGDVILVPSMVDFGIVKYDERVERTIVVKNLSGESIQLIGGSANCSCITTFDLPATLPAGQTVPIRIQFHAPQKGKGVITQSVSLWTDKDLQRVDFLIQCRLSE